MRSQAAGSLLRLARAAGPTQGVGLVGAGTIALARGFADDASLLKTPLYDLHVENGGAWGGAAHARKEVHACDGVPPLPGSGCAGLGEEAGAV